MELNKNSKLKNISLSEKDIKEDSASESKETSKDVSLIEPAKVEKPKLFHRLFGKKTHKKEPKNPELAELNQADVPPKKPKKKIGCFGIFARITLVLLLLILLAGGLFAYYIVPPVLSIKKSVEVIQTEETALKDDMNNKRFTELPDHLVNIQTELKNIRVTLDKFDFIEQISFLAPYYKNVQTGKEILDNSNSLIDKALPKIKIFVTDLDASIGLRKQKEGVPSTTATAATTTSTSMSTNRTPETTPTPVITPVASQSDLNAIKCNIPTNNTPTATPTPTSTTGETPTPTDVSGVPVVSDPTKMSDIISVLPEAVDIYTEIEPELQILLHSINKLDPEALPSQTPKEYKDKLVSLLSTTTEYEKNFPKYSDLIKRVFVGLPEMLGSKKPVTYLIIFQNEKEMRASGGLLTAYGIVTVDKGKVVGEITTRDMWDLQQDVWDYGGPGYYNIYGELVLMVNGCGSEELRSQDSGLYPDLQVTMKTFTEYYDILQGYLPGKYVPYDHVMIVNTFFASDMVSLVEPLILDDCQKVTAENLAKVIFENREGGDGRKSNIGTVAKLAQDSFSSIPSEKFPQIASTLIKTVQSKNIAFYTKDQTMENFFDNLGMTGRTNTTFNGDYLHVNESQVCGLKANFYLYDTVTQNISIHEDGRISKTMNVHWENDKVYDPAESDIISGSLSFPYRAWIRFMAPPNTVFTYSNGYEKSKWLYYNPVDYYDDVVQKSVNDNIIWFEHRRFSDAEPAPTYDLDVALNLPGSVTYTPENGYKMLIQKHPGKKDEKYIVGLSYNGLDYHIEFVLDRDKVVTFKDGVLSVANNPHPLDDYSWMLDNLLPDILKT